MESTVKRKKKKMSINKKQKKEKKNVVPIHNEVFLHSEENLNQEICNKMNGTRKYTEWGSSDPDRQTPHVLSYMWSLASNLTVFMFNLDHKWKPENLKGGFWGDTYFKWEEIADYQ